MTNDESSKRLAALTNASKTRDVSSIRRYVHAGFVVAQIEAEE